MQKTTCSSSVSLVPFSKDLNSNFSMMRNSGACVIHFEINSKCSITKAPEFLIIEKFELTSLEKGTRETLKEHAVICIVFQSIFDSLFRVEKVRW